MRSATTVGTPSTRVTSRQFVVDILLVAAGIKVSDLAVASRLVPPAGSGAAERRG